MRHGPRLVGIAVAWLLLVTPAIARAQVEPKPPRDRAAEQQRTGTATVSGRVVDGITGEAIARAKVRVMMPGVSRPPVLSEADGSFSFTAVPAGGFAIAADKSGYLTARFPEPGRSIRRAAQPLLIRDGQALHDLVLKMYRGSAISGRVVDAHGDPVEYASVSALRLMPGAKPQMRAGQQTNDLGEFRLPRLEAGTYVVVAGPRRHSPDELPAGSEQQPQPLPTYYPSTPSIDQAQAITLDKGQSATGIDVVLAEGAIVTVNGIVLRRDGQPISGHAFVNARSSGRTGMTDGGGTNIRPDGTFRLMLAPGDYIVQAHVQPGRGAPLPQRDQSGMVRVSVGGSPVETVTLTVGPPATASGRVVFEGETPPPPVPRAPFGLPLYSDDGDCSAGDAQVSPDWTFKVEGLMGTCAAPPRLTFGRWTLKAATRAGVDLLAAPLTFEPGQHVDGVQLVFTDRRSELQFLVSDDKGQPTIDYLALVFTVDKSRWDGRNRFVQPFYVPAPEQLRQMQQALPSSAPPEAQMAIDAMRRRAMPVSPGEYFVVALDDIGYEDTHAPAVLERLAAHAIRVTVTEGAKLEVPLRRLELADLLR